MCENLVQVELLDLFSLLHQDKTIQELIGLKSVCWPRTVGVYSYQQLFVEVDVYKIKF